LTRESSARHTQSDSSRTISLNSNPVKNFIIIISCHLFFIYLFIHFFLKYLFLMDLLSLYKYQLGYWQICDELDRCRVVEEKVGTEAPVSSGTNHLITTNFSLILPCGFSFCSVDSFMGLRENLPRFFFYIEFYEAESTVIRPVDPPCEK